MASVIAGICTCLRLDGEGTRIRIHLLRLFSFWTDS